MVIASARGLCRGFGKAIGEGVSAQFDLQVETAKRLNPHQELELSRLALARNPDSKVLRSRLAALLNLSDQFAATIDLLNCASDRSVDETILLIFAHLSQETEAHNLLAERIARDLAETAETPVIAAAALADMGKAQVRLGRDEAEATLRQALALDPHNKNACKRLAALLLQRGDIGEVLQQTETLLERGAAHSRLFAARVMALTKAGRLEEARNLEGFARLSKRAMLPTPDGFADLASFNRELAQQLLNHPELRYERYGTASELTWRIDSPQSVHAPLVGVLLQGLRSAITDHIDSLGGVDHPWLRARPETAKLHCWSVITEDDGYETWHVHQFGWLSGTYYVQIPDKIASGNDEGGCLAFGLPDELVGTEAAEAFGGDFLRPQAGMFSLFPSHCYHRTFPHQQRERRICVAFDVRPG